MRFRSVASDANKKLPKKLGDLIRRLIHAWGMLTASWRMDPDFIVVGAQRSGTTTLFRVLNDHPEVVRPTVSKGIGYFDLNYAKGERWYRAHFPIRALAMARTGGRAQTFESDGYYLFHPLAVERIASDLPRVKIVVMVRDPVERAYSAHKHESVRGYETEGFEAALALEAHRLSGEEEKIRANPLYESYDHRHHAYVARGRYAMQIQRLIGLVGRDRVYIVDADRFFVDAGELTELFAWLGLSAWLPKEVKQWNAQPRGPMNPAARARLEEEFASGDLDLAKLMGRVPFWVSGS